MYVVEAQDVSDAFHASLRLLKQNGQIVSPRGNMTLEVSPVTVVIKDPSANILLAIGRVINPIFAVAETLWVLEGTNEPWVTHYNKQLQEFMDDGQLRGAYGPRLRRWQGEEDQFETLLSRLRTDPQTRRAVLQFWDPSIDGVDSRDVACTLSMRFLIREGCLDGFVTMRSQDIWWGFPYDIHLFSTILRIIAYWLNLEVGYLHHSVDSLHIYERHWVESQSVVTENRNDVSVAICECPSLSNLSSYIQSLRSERSAKTFPEPWFTMRQLMLSYRAWNRTDYGRAWELQQTCIEPYREASKRWYKLLERRKYFSGDDKNE